MIIEREKDFEEKYSVLSPISAVIFTFYFIASLLILNLTYAPDTIKTNGVTGLFVLFIYYILSSIVLSPVLMVVNALLLMAFKKTLKKIYTIHPLTGFIFLPLAMTIIPFVMTQLLGVITPKLNSFDYGFIYITTWISSVIQYMWILKNLRNVKQTNKQALSEKEIAILKSTDNIDYF